MIQIVLPAHLRTLAKLSGDAEVDVPADENGHVSLRQVLDALESAYPMLRGAIREHGTQKRRPYVRFFACQQDLSHDSPDTPLPEAVVTGNEPLVVLGAIAGG